MPQYQSQNTLSRKETQAMNISLVVGILMLAIKWSAYSLTHSVAIFSDAMETIVHIFAVGFASYSLRVTYRPPDKDHHFGHDKISYFSAGLEGGLIILAAFVIIYTAVEKIIVGITLEQITLGTSLTAFAGAVNALLGWFLVRTGKRERSLIVTANGKHILTDAWTSFGAILGLLIAQATGLTWVDPVAALLFGGNIIFEGMKLLRSSADGLMDKTNSEFEQKVRIGLEDFCLRNDISFHRLRMRESGQQVYADFHLQFKDGTPIEVCHTIATAAEQTIEKLLLPTPVDVTSHLESAFHPPGHT
ncbi:MAG: cation transporter [Bacteroidetes bacterium]|nr:cation transporter [Bacteroidota bacterium]